MLTPLVELAEEAEARWVDGREADRQASLPQRGIVAP